MNEQSDDVNSSRCRVAYADLNVLALFMTHAPGGYTVARVNTSNTGVAATGEKGHGPLRVWPGGVNMARAIGDCRIGEGLLPYPHITQLKLPTSGTSHFILASDGVWDSGVPESEMFRALRAQTLSRAASQIISQTASTPLGDDTTLIAVEIRPTINKVIEI